jgi:hypothetical protein
VWWSDYDEALQLYRCRNDYCPPETEPEYQLAAVAAA